MSAGKESSNIEDLIVQLCNSFAKNDQALASQLCKIAFGFLSSSLHGEAFFDEELTVSKITQVLGEKSQKSVEEFQIIYGNLLKNEVIINRGSILKFLYALSSHGQLKTLKWEGFKPIDTDTFSLSAIKLSSRLSQESLRSLYQRQSNFQSVQSSSTNIPSMQTMASSIWTSKSEIDIGSVQQSSECNLISEYDLLQDLIYAFQGIEGRFLRKEVGGPGFIVDLKTCKSLSPVHRGLVERLLGMSFLHNQVKQFCDAHEDYSGVIDLALVATLREELSDYYRTIAVLQSLIGKNSERMQLTLHKMIVYIHDHKTRFEWLAYIADQCSDKRGGAVVSAVHGFLQHGSKCAQKVAEKVLTAVCKPLFIMLSRWLLDGEINDACNEFFIEVRDITAVERLWYDKYHVRKTMVPSFITMEQAEKILATGKNINFLRQICKDSAQINEKDALKNLMQTSSANSIFAPEQSLEFDSILEKVYKKTSLRVLDLLKNKYQLFDHFQSLRRYLLLGQGDFIRHLLELLVPELNKIAHHIYTHSLTAILESAIRDTNAQFEDAETISRLSVSFMAPSHGDTGWDVFSLVYLVDGPVATIFQPTMTIYQSLFGALWKAKRMELVLANMRKQQLSMAKIFRKIQELKPVMHAINLLTSEMIHFLHQTQYYFLFEVLECSWAEMQKKINQAETLDDIIKAHGVFLASVQCGVLLDEHSRELFSHLRSIYNFILNLEKHQEALNEAAKKEFEAFNKLRAKQKGGSYGLTNEDEIIAKVRTDSFHYFLSTIKTEVKHLSQNYTLFVKKYLHLLSSSSNMNLQLLSVRLSFNSYYNVK